MVLQEVEEVLIGDVLVEESSHSPGTVLSVCTREIRVLLAVFHRLKRDNNPVF